LLISLNDFMDEISYEFENKSLNLKIFKMFILKILLHIFRVHLFIRLHFFKFQN